MIVTKQDERLKQIWELYKSGIRKQRMVEITGLDEDTLQQYLEEAQKKFGVGAYKSKDVSRAKEEPPLKHVPAPVKEPEPWERPKAKYSNKSWQETIEELLSTPI